jgi:hypothetical protein
MQFEVMFKKNVLPVLFIFAILVSMLPVSNRAHATSGTNLALNKTVSAAPFLYGYLPSVVDGIYSYGADTTRWSSYGSGNATDYLDIDFGSIVSFNQVKLYLFNDGGGVKPPASYNVQYLDGSTWVDAINQAKTPTIPAATINTGGPTSANTLNTVDFGTVTTQKLRVVFTNAGSGAYSGVVELEVFLTQTADEIAASAVETQIAGLPLQANVVLLDKTAIEAARTVYDNLTVTQQAVVNNYSKLTSAETAIAVLEAAYAADVAAASAVETQIAGLPLQANVVLLDKTAIEAARTVYDNLTVTQQAVVNNYSKLTSAETAIAVLEASLAEIHLLSVFTNVEGNTITLNLPTALNITFSINADNFQVIADGERVTVTDADYDLNDSTDRTIILTFSSPVLLNKTLVSLTLQRGAFKTSNNELNKGIAYRPVTNFRSLDLSLDNQIGVDDIVRMIGNPALQIDVNQDGIFNHKDISSILGQISAVSNL